MRMRLWKQIGEISFLQRVADLSLETECSHLRKAQNRDARSQLRWFRDVLLGGAPGKVQQEVLERL